MFKISFQLLVSIWNCLLTDYLPPPEIVYQLEGNAEPFERMPRSEMRDAEQPPPNPKEAILRTSIGQNRLSQEDHEQILLAEYSSLLAQVGQQPSSSSIQPENEPIHIRSPTSSSPVGTRL